ncbi:unnamed protein product [Eruca vesicaria subsp. sativa]|uniref:GRF-type domain-containing protein n=1 Tax=Eruca vesicaria subsp. sativa TaxID=29727 RepID=A0ABC8KCX8_ERUVS|nr:unnamed protein product [Eruca vesicaria subsp. sativa]
MYAGSGLSRIRSSTRSRNSGRGFCFCGLRAHITQSWTDKNPCQRFYGCPCYKLGDGCDYFSWFDEEEGMKWQRTAFLEARDEINRKSAVIG